MQVNNRRVDIVRIHRKKTLMESCMVFSLIADKVDGCKPVLKWAGGKSQLLDALLPSIPSCFGKYIEPFVGGGALFFALAPQHAVIADVNPELINLYQIIARDAEALIDVLQRYPHDKAFFYQLRAIDWRTQTPLEAAARTIYLNRTCFNGLYRVNQKGQFNVPFGDYINPRICDATNLRQVSALLQGKEIVLGDYKTVLTQYATSGDCVFLDPPYLPISHNSDFTRYTKESFSKEDHVELAREVDRLANLGCHIILTNSNHSLVHKLFGHYPIEIFQTKRNINSSAHKRTGEDVIVNIGSKQVRSNEVLLKPMPALFADQILRYPPTRFMGSKSKLLPQLRDVIRQFQCQNVLDLFSGSGIVSYLLKTEGKRVVSNDYMALSATYAKAMIENSFTTLLHEESEFLLTPKANDRFVQETFRNLYFSDEENALIDNIRAGIKQFVDPYKRAIATSALIRACCKKRPRGIFTYVGQRYNDGRQDLKTSFGDHFLAAVELINGAIFDNGQENTVRQGDALTLRLTPDLVYMDPPYYSPLSDNSYIRRYHFIEGLACDWQGIEIQWHTKTKKFKSYPTPFASRQGSLAAFDQLFGSFKDSVLIVSYSSNSQPTQDEMLALFAQHQRRVEVISIDYRYSFANQGAKVKDNKNQAKEYIFVGY